MLTPRDENNRIISVRFPKYVPRRKGGCGESEAGWTEGNAFGVTFGGPSGTNISKLTWDRLGKH